MIGARPDLSGARRAPLWSEHTPPLCEVFTVSFLGALPGACCDGRDEVALARVVDRVLEQILEGQLAQAFRQIRPDGNTTWNRDRVPTETGHFLSVSKSIVGPCSGRTSGAVQTDEFFAIPNDRKGVGADAVHRWLDHGERDRRRERGIDGVASPAIGMNACLDRERLGCCDDIARQYWRAFGGVRK